jgi:hypothetical protein
MQAPLQDPKQLLRKLIAELSINSTDDTSDSDSGLIEKLTKAVDDIEASQVQSVQAQAQQEVLFSMTLPFADSNPIELTVRRGPRQEGEQPVLTVNVHSKTPDLGPVWLKTQLMNALQVELTMWAEQSFVVEKLGHALIYWVTNCALRASACAPSTWCMAQGPHSSPIGRLQAAAWWWMCPHEPLT